MAVDEHKKYLEERLDALFKSENHWILFGRLNLYWNPLSFSLLDGLLNELVLKNMNFRKIKAEMVKYKEDMERFKEATPLVLFCQVAPDMLGLPEADPPPGFQKVVTEHQWPEAVTLKDVEQFRKRFQHLLGLPECAMLVNRIRTGCFVITWFATLPASATQLLGESDDSIKLLQDFKVITVKLNEEYVYKDPFQLRVSKISDVLDIIYWEVGVTKHLLGRRCTSHAIFVMF